MEYTDRLRLLALNDSRCAPAYEDDTGLDSAVLDPKTIALIRLAALVAVGGAVASYGALANAAVDAGPRPPRSSTYSSVSSPLSACLALSPSPLPWRSQWGMTPESPSNNPPGLESG